MQNRCGASRGKTYCLITSSKLTRMLVKSEIKNKAHHWFEQFQVSVYDACQIRKLPVFCDNTQTIGSPGNLSSEYVSIAAIPLKSRRSHSRENTLCLVYALLAAMEILSNLLCQLQQGKY